LPSDHSGFQAILNGHQPLDFSHDTDELLTCWYGIGQPQSDHVLG